MSFWRVLGNIVWFIFYGLWAFIAWGLAGILLCITIVGIPFGLQCFKIGMFILMPFGKEINYGQFGAGSVLMNILWIVFFGFGFAVTNIICGVLWCITIVGIPFGLQCFKMATVSFLPFGATIQDVVE